MTSAATAHDEAAHEGGLPAGYGDLSLDESQVAALGLSTEVAAVRPLTRTVRTVGVVAVDETRTAHVHAKVRGFIDKVHVSFVGESVRPGQVLAAIYSQEVYAAEVEYLSVLDRFADRPVATGDLAEAELRAQKQLLAAARRRLSLWDVPKAEVDRLEASREAKRTFPLLAPRAGTVVAKQALDGAFVDPSIELYTLTDLSRVWVLADLYEADVPHVRVGQRATLQIEGVAVAPEVPITFLAPTLDDATRTLKARFELPNPDGAIRPGAFVTVSMDLGISQTLTVPDSAVIRTGPRSIVFVVHDGRHVTPREVRVGRAVAGLSPIESGLAAGERVAVSAQFLLDSESRLRAASARGGGRGHAH